MERLVATPLEKLLTQIDGVEHIYSTSMTGRAVVTVRFFVGEDREDSLVKLYNKILSNQDLVPETVESWAIKPIEIDDVPILIATLWSENESVGDYELRRLAEEVALDFQRIVDTNRIDITGGRPRTLRIELDVTAMAARNTGLGDVLFALRESSVRSPAGVIERGDVALDVETSALIGSADELLALTVNVIDGVSIRLGDIARVIDGADEPGDYHWITLGAAHTTADRLGKSFPAVDIAVAKKKGANAVAVAQSIKERLVYLTQSLLPSGVHYEITRDYGETADAKINDLLASLLIALATVIALISVFLGWRAALVVAIAVPVCYGVTLLLDFAAGYTINRVTLFALILALGLLVDDPITGVDNMERHLGTRDPDRDIVRAMMEIRVPLVMSTIAIVIAFAPMSFITGMMGPYMSPMAFNVPIAVIMSTLVAFVVTPWVGRRLLKPTTHISTIARAGWYTRLLESLITSRRRSYFLLGSVAVALVCSLLLPLLRVVPLKLLPYDNKNEFQVILDAPEGTTLERTDAILDELARWLSRVPEVVSVTGYSGTHSAIDFNGLVRHYFLRGRDHEGELRVQLVDKMMRADQSHALLLRLRPQITAIADRAGVSAKLVEVPPGPPVIASVVAEIYGGPDTSYATLIEAARATAQRLAVEVGVVDVDVSAAAPSARLAYIPDREKAALSGVSVRNLAETLTAATDGIIAGYIDAPDEAQSLPIRVTIPYAQRGDLSQLHVTGMTGIAKIRERGGVTDAPTPLVSMAELGSFEAIAAEQPIYHKDLRPVAYAFAEVVGRVPAEVIYDIDADLDIPADTQFRPVAGRTYFRSGAGLAWQLPGGTEVSWGGEGEWNITLRVFRDLGIAFGVAILGLFAVIRLQTMSANLTLIILLAIPLTAIGIMPGFWLLNALTSTAIGNYEDHVLFTATAMIGMIALAGIVVRNSLILIEFIEQQRGTGASVLDAVLGAGEARARPVLLTAATTLLGNLVITLDPVFSGLAWAIVFGIVASTAL
ncbi:MAG: efflux RND transporter permease subunit, partial [Gammaproteobacteria bacterium]|nr:efflux RND transporter permease subunit [Gammaproteobacteria bacterium]